MSEKIERLLEDLGDTASKFWMYPDFVITNGLKRTPFPGFEIAYEPTYTSKWGMDYFRFDFNGGVNWNFDKCSQLEATVKKYPQFDIMYPKKSDHYVKIALKHLPQIRYDDLINNFLIFNMEGYEGKTPMSIFKALDTTKYEPYSYYDAYGNEPIKDLKAAKSYALERLALVIDSKSITVKAIGKFANLFEEISEIFTRPE